MKSFIVNKHSGQVKMLHRKLYRFLVANRWILGLAFVFILFIGIYQEYIDSRQALTMAQLRKDLIKLPYSRNKHGHHDIIVSAYMNSGSRLTGKLLGFLNQSFYFYEPFWKFTVWDFYKPPDLRCSTIEGPCRSDVFLFTV
ncbi:uncharacterized protein LOC132756909 [Ruditapes philippinarum]|uniref:uncharacterized protein LOC132756909 n=1 Tax=Ruditapes philippinarum TaxID=129788 RepID=UPI00295ADD66|nr:uncharacterized protein LOC132756909 [Ruditapes philippinarum]